MLAILNASAPYYLGILSFSGTRNRRKTLTLPIPAPHRSYVETVLKNAEILLSARRDIGLGLLRYAVLASVNVWT